MSSLLEHRFGWRFTFYIAILPGLTLACLLLFLREPIRGAAEVHSIAATAKRNGSPYLLVLSIPTMWWLILSGAFHNFNMYAIGYFLSPFLQRVHHTSKLSAGMISMIVYGLAGIPGLIVGGLLGDRMARRKANGRLVVATVAIFISAPLMFLALNQTEGHVWSFVLLSVLGMTSMYVYYSTVYSAIHDVIEPALRGTAMALYFFAMYVLGASLGPVGMGILSNFFTRRSALAAGVTDTSFQTLRPFAASGLHSALYVIPVLGVALGLVLFAASRTVAHDMEKLQRWMRGAAAASEAAGDDALKVTTVKLDVVTE